MAKKIIKTRNYKASRKTVYYYDDGTKETRYWQSTDSFCNEMGV